MISVRKAQIDDAGVLLMKMGEPQRKELLASHGDILVPITQGIEMSVEAYTFVGEGEVLAIAGIVPFPWTQGGASPWLLTSVEALRYPVSMVKISKKVVLHWLEEWNTLINYIDSDYEQAIAWAKCIGFQVGPQEPYGVSGKMFNKIVMEK